jgi:O-acetyl-ADP-ribose deacetylase (regulator of RNase III)
MTRETNRDHVHEVSGDILLTDAPVIAHGVAPNDSFHSGLALQLRERFPAMYKDFRHYCQTHHPRSGDMWMWSGTGPHGPVRIACLLTQAGSYDHGGKPGPAQIDYVNHALKKLAKWIEHEQPAAVAVPCLATGVGALPWNHVQPLIHQHLGKLGVPIVLYSTYHRGVKAVEPIPTTAQR